MKLPPFRLPDDAPIKIVSETGAQPPTARKIVRKRRPITSMDRLAAASGARFLKAFSSR